MTEPVVASREAWLAARLELLEEEKALTRARDAVTAKRQALPWVPVETDYRFEGPEGPVGLADLFGPHSQLVLQHFMYGPEWQAGCVSCSFWVDNFDGTAEHLAARDIGYVLVARAPIERLEAYRTRMGWSLPFVSSLGTSFNQDFNVSFADDHTPEKTVTYNYRETNFPASEAPGISIFAKDDAGRIYHTYSTYSRGLDILNSVYHLIDLTPKGRDEAAGNMHWLRHRDSYEAD